MAVITSHFIIIQYDQIKFLTKKQSLFQTRLQIQGQKCDQQFTQLRYRGMTDAFIKISRQEGVGALYSG